MQSKGWRAVTAVAAGVVLSAASGAVAQEDAAGVAVEEAQPKSFLEGWKGSIEAGLNGSTGNTERFNFRAGISGDRETDAMRTKASAIYTYANEDGDQTESRVFANLRNDWIINDSPWFLWALGSFEFDEFQDWDMRLTGAVGGGYEFIKNDKTTLLGRLGIGASREIGGSDNTIRPEAVIGGDFTHNFTDRQRFTATADLFPDLSEVGEFRFIGTAAYEILIDPDNGLSLKLGVADRYDSTPGAGQKRNDLDYFLLLVWSF